VLKCPIAELYLLPFFYRSLTDRRRTVDYNCALTGQIVSFCASLFTGPCTKPVQSFTMHLKKYINPPSKLALPRILLPLYIATKTQYTFAFPTNATCPDLTTLVFITIIIFYAYNSALCNFIHPPVTFSFLGPNILPFHARLQLVFFP
jgi:hypothetical protein